MLLHNIFLLTNNKRIKSSLSPYSIIEEIENRLTEPEVWQNRKEVLEEAECLLTLLECSDSPQVLCDCTRHSKHFFKIFFQIKISIIVFLKLLYERSNKNCARVLCAIIRYAPPTNQYARLITVIFIMLFSVTSLEKVAALR